MRMLCKFPPSSLHSFFKLIHVQLESQTPTSCINCVASVGTKCDTIVCLTFPLFLLSCCLPIFIANLTVTGSNVFIIIFGYFIQVSRLVFNKFHCLMQLFLFIAAKWSCLKFVFEFLADYNNIMRKLKHFIRFVLMDHVAFVISILTSSVKVAIILSTTQWKFLINNLFI